MVVRMVMISLWTMRWVDPAVEVFCMVIFSEDLDHTHTRTITLWHSCRQRARWVTSLECSCISCAAGPVLSSYVRAPSRSGAIISSVMCKCELIFLTNTHRHICNRYTVSNGLTHFMCVCFIIPIFKLDLLHESAHHILPDFFFFHKLCADYGWGFVVNFKL